MALDRLGERLLSGWVFQGRNGHNEFVLLGPYAEPNQITYQVRIGRKVVYSGSARDAFEVFMRTSKLPPIPLAKVSRKRIEDHNNFTN